VVKPASLATHPMTRIHHAAALRAKNRNRRLSLLQPPTSSKPKNKCTEARELSSDAPSEFQPAVIVTGHTHHPGRREGPRGLIRPNTGSWKPRARPQGRSRFRIEQPLDVVVIDADKAGKPDIRVLSAVRADDLDV